MGRITDTDADALSRVSNRDRARILYRYLVQDKNQKTIAQEVFHDYGDWAAFRVSSVTRGFGFHNGRGKGRYGSVPAEIIQDFVAQYQPENYDGGLNEGTFDRFLQSYHRQLEQQRQQEEDRRRQAAEAEERRRRQQEEDRLRRQAWEEEQARIRQQQAEERRRQEEQQRREQEAREREAREQEARRQAAVDRGDHQQLMHEGFEALKRKDYALARAKAEQGWALSPLVGMLYLFAFAAAGQGDRSGAAQKAAEALKYYKEHEPEYWDLAVLLLENEGRTRPVEYGRKLYEKDLLGRLTKRGLSHLGRCIYRELLRREGGLRYWVREKRSDRAYMAFAKAVSLLIAERVPPTETNGALMLDCAYVLAQGKEAQAALALYDHYRDDDTLSLESPAYDLAAHQGYCWHLMGDRVSALHIWCPDLLVHGRLDTQPLDAIVQAGYDRILLEEFPDRSDLREHLDFAQSYLDGRIPGSAFFGRYHGDRWYLSRGLDADQDCRWYYGEDELWHLEVYTRSAPDRLTQQAKGIFGKLFGR